MVIVNKNILLLKGREDENEKDKYECLLEANGFSVNHLQILDFQYINLAQLNEKLNNAESYSGIIFTSPRGIIATKKCLNGSKINDSWFGKHNFVVGEATYELASRELNLTCEGKDSGNANNLAQLIISKNNSETIELPFLFPCGNLKKETLEKSLTANNIKVDATTVYETVASDNIKDNFMKLTSNFENYPEYIVYFSPSGVNFTTSIFKESSKEFENVKLVAIGPSTEEALKAASLPVYTVAAKPTEVQLFEAISKDC